MAVTEEQIAGIYDLLESIPDLSHRKMMGGLSIYSAGQIFSILSGDGTVFLKADGRFAEEMESAGARQFSMVNKNGKTSSMGYWTLPDVALDDPDVACSWAERALSKLR